MKLEQLERHGILGPPERLRAPRATGMQASPSSVVGEDSESLLLGDVVYEPGRPHGRHVPYEVRSLDAATFSLACRDQSIGAVRLRNAVFLDTETTGLGLGTGTYVFLVGAGFWTEQGFTVRQFFLAGPHDEARYLTRLRGFLDQFEAVVSFNGKAFDWPLLENRFVLHRSQAPLQGAPHVDLLHVARRLWKRRLKSCSLGSLESQVLHVERTQEDVPGFLIPEIYFRFVQTGDAEPLRRVFYHNAQDILSLATLALHVQTVIRPSERGLVDMPEDWLSLGKLFERSDDMVQAAQCFEKAAESDLCNPAACEALIALARMHKRARRWEQAVSTWTRLIQSNQPESFMARIELAKYYEHIERNYMQALGHVQFALQLSELFGTGSATGARRELDVRLARLVKRSLVEKGRLARSVVR